MFPKYKMLLFNIERRENWSNSLQLVQFQTVPGNKNVIDLIRFIKMRT